MVLQIRETIVLQGVELEEKADSSHFWAFGSFFVLMGKHGFAEKTSLKVEMVTGEVRAYSEFRGADSVLIVRTDILSSHYTRASFSGLTMMRIA
jgi:hypothetical protein